MSSLKLSPEALYHSCDTSRFSFESTAELATAEEVSHSLGQPRAVEAMRFGTGMRVEGYNIYALGPPGMGRHTLVSQMLQQRANELPVPQDICYVNNFQDSSKPRYLLLPPGWGPGLAQDLDNLIEEARNGLKASFESEEYQNRRQAIEQELKDKQQQAFEELQEKAKERGLSVVRTPNGIAFAPVWNGEIVSPDDFQKWPEEDRKRIEKEIEDLQNESQRLFQKIPAWQRETRERLNKLNREVASFTLSQLMEETRKKYESLDEVQKYLDAVEKDIVDNVSTLLNPQEQQQGYGQQQAGGEVSGSAKEAPALRKYRVNVLVDRSEQKEAPVIYEDNPTYANLVGRVEHIPQMGALITDFHLIKPGALHRANGGAIILDAHKVLMQPGAWEGLKRALKSNEVKIESLAEMFSLISTVSLEPQPIPLSVKVVLIGSPLIYYILRELDPEFGKLFKIAADFDVQADRNQHNEDLFARLLSRIVQRDGLHHFDKSGVARTIEHSSRLIGDSEKLSTHVQSISDLVREADYFAEASQAELVSAEHVQQAIEAQIYRSDRIRERIQEEIKRGTILIDTKEAKAGQINGLSVLKLGDFMFGRPNRITARVRLGKGEVIDIEREVKLSGPLHSKGVLILSGYLGSRYALERPLSLSASLVFEQSYGGIEGDSASSAELFALLSAISGVPIKQSFAVTGSINQHGEIQAIGGVNEKIEGFFDVCAHQGFDGSQGVIIPASNAKHLMLRRDVIQAVERGDFQIYAIRHADEGLELLTGLEAGEADENNVFPEGTLNGKVQQQLMKFAEKGREFSQAAQGGRRDSEQ